MPRSCPNYHTLRQRLSCLIPQASRPQHTNLALFVYGLLAAWHSHLPKIALYLPLEGNLKTAQQRVERLLQNPAVAATDWYKGVARAVLARFVGGEIDLILDATDLAERHFLLFVALRYKGRAFPVLWRMLPGKGCSAFSEQQALLTEVAALLPQDMTVTLLADREYGSADLIKLCLLYRWHFVFRLKKNRWCRLRGGRAFQLSELPLRPGTDWCDDGITLDDVPNARFSLCCGWSEDNSDDEPWYLLSHLPATREVLARYGGRFSIEEMFRDFKEQGFRLEKTRLRDTERVSRLVLCVCIASVIALLMGEAVEAQGKRRLVERASKRQMSLFQLGLRYLKRLTVQGHNWTELIALRI